MDQDSTTSSQPPSKETPAAKAKVKARPATIPLEEVAKAAGVSKGTIYHRFGSRRGLIDAVVDELVAERMQAIVRR